MAEKIMDINTISSYLMKTLQVQKVKVQEIDRVITIMPIDDIEAGEKFSCPFLGIAVDSNLTVDKFLEWKHEERATEYEKDLHS